MDAGLMVISYHKLYRRYRRDKLKEEENAKKIEDLLPKEKLEVLEKVKQEKTKLKLKKSDRRCPECNRYFSIINVKGIDLEACLYCNSLWFDDDELKKLTNLPEDIPGKKLKSRKSKYKCPICGQPMTEFVFIKKSNLLIDGCKDEHGVYLESDELRRALLLSE